MVNNPFVCEDRKFLPGEIDDLLKLENGLSEWEVNFIDSIAKQLRVHGGTTDKQAVKVHEVWDRHCGSKR